MDRYAAGLYIFRHFHQLPVPIVVDPLFFSRLELPFARGVRIGVGEGDSPDASMCLNRLNCEKPVSKWSFAVTIPDQKLTRTT